jgi:putative addiction module component (TIGR02574 family)
MLRKRGKDCALGFSGRSDTELIMTNETLDIERLTPRERLELIARLWDSLAPEDVHLSAAQERELAQRMIGFDADTKDAVSWEVIEIELDRRSR